MFRPSTAAAPKRTKAKPAPKGKRTAATATAASGDSKTDTGYLAALSRVEGAAVGNAIRMVAFHLAEEIQEKFRVLTAFLIAADGEEQLGLHELRSGVIKFRTDMMDLQMSIHRTKVRGEAGHTDE